MVEDADRQLVKQVIKETGSKLLERAVPGPAVASWSTKVEHCEQQLQDILQVTLKNCS